MEIIRCKVCIVGAGSAGMGAAYALKGISQITDLAYTQEQCKGLVVVEQFDSLGGTAVNGWVETWISGITPQYLSDIFHDVGEYDQATIENNFLSRTFAADEHKSKISADGLFIDSTLLSARYLRDMQNSGVCILSGHAFCSAMADKVNSRAVRSIVVENKITAQKKIIIADFFIDSSGDGVLCRAMNGTANEDYFHGEDDNIRFKESLAPELGVADEKMLNVPSLFYKVKKNGTEPQEVKKIDYITATEKPKYINGGGYIMDYLPNYYDAPMWVNPLAAMLDPADQDTDIKPGLLLQEGGCKRLYAELSSKRQYEHWKYIKENLLTQSVEWWNGYNPKRQKDYVHSGFHAPMLGVRETYRINCHRMLVEQDLTKTINPNNLEDFIACGCHVVDIHGGGNIAKGSANDTKDMKTMHSFNNHSIRPSGIPYECIVPQKLDNVLIACRAFGSSHIALSARRVNKDMAQLGWAAGHAIAICLEKGMKKTTEVKDHILDLQDRIGLAEGVSKMVTLMKEDLQKEIKIATAIAK